ELVDDLDAQAFGGDVQQQLILEWRQRLAALDRGIQSLHQLLQTRLVGLARQFDRVLDVVLDLRRTALFRARAARQVHRPAKLDHAVAAAAGPGLARPRERG